MNSSFLLRLFEWPRCCLVGLVLRLILLVWGVIQDANSAVKYTDIDYEVYSDAAKYLALGESPYQRATYRYTPLLAGLLMPVVLLPAFGKMIFIVVDLLLAGLMRQTMIARGMSPQRATRYGALPILLNPLVLNLSTRGNADILIVALVVGMIYALVRGRIRTAAIVYGLAVHVKIYPIIYAPAIVLFLNDDFPAAAAPSGNEKPAKFAERASFILRDLYHPFSLKLRFFLWSSTIFFLLTGLCYVVYGYQFLFETYLYHITRIDTRHNFSVYFYELYLESSAKLLWPRLVNLTAAENVDLGILTPAVIPQLLLSPDDKLLPFLSFLPQLLVLLTFSFTLYRDLPLCLFAQTLVFVAFNKVVTAQYFLWWIVPLILIAPQSRLTWKHAVMLGAGWMATEMNWLRTGYVVEFLAQPAFYEMWVAGILFFLANCTLLTVVIVQHRFQPVFSNGILTRFEHDDSVNDSPQVQMKSSAKAR